MAMQLVNLMPGRDVSHPVCSRVSREKFAKNAESVSTGVSQDSKSIKCMSVYRSARGVRSTLAHPDLRCNLAHFVSGVQDLDILRMQDLGEGRDLAYVW